MYYWHVSTGNTVSDSHESSDDGDDMCCDVLVHHLDVTSLDIRPIFHLLHKDMSCLQDTSKIIGYWHPIPLPLPRLLQPVTNCNKYKISRRHLSSSATEYSVLHNLHFFMFVWGGFRGQAGPGFAVAHRSGG